MKKQTAVEWLLEQISVKNGYIIFSPSNIDWDGLNEIFEQAKAMEREQIEDAYYDGQSLNAKSVTSQMIIDNSISYYNEIYKGGEE